MKIKVTFAGRILSIFFTISGVVLFVAALGSLSYFLMDLPLLDEYGVPRTSRPNEILNLRESSIYVRIALNTALTLLFWHQHIVMSNGKFKSFMTSFSNYPVYERGLFNTCKILFLIFRC